METDWHIATRMTSSGVFTVTTITDKCSLVCSHRDGKKVFSPAARSTTVFLPYRDDPTDLDAMVQSFLSERRVKEVLYKQLDNTSERTFTVDYKPQPGTYVLESDGTKMELLKFSFKVEVEHTDTPINFVAGRYGKREVAIGSSSEPGTELYYALVRKEGDRVEGLLVDKTGLRKLAIAR